MFYAGKLEVRPPAAPTTDRGTRGGQRSVSRDGSMVTLAGGFGPIVMQRRFSR
jgi:hypothetical protein